MGATLVLSRDEARQQVVQAVYRMINEPTQSESIFEFADALRNYEHAILRSAGVVVKP